MGSGNSKPNLPDSQTFVVHVGQKLKSLPYNIREGHPVALLNLQRNQIKELPIGLTKLKTLMLTSNDMEGLTNNIQKALDSYISLESLDLSKNKIVVMHNRIDSLDVLFINRNFLKEMPELLNLSQMEASNNQITELKSSSERIQRLHLRQNFIKTISPSLIFKRLETIELQMNKLEIMPDMSVMFPNLSVANLSMNRLRKIEGRLPATLQDFNVGYNKLEKLPELPESLLYLTVSSNKIKHLQKLPSSIVKIACDDNEIESAEECDLKCLDYVNFKGNKLKKMPNYGKLNEMNYFIFSQNDIDCIDLNYINYNGEEYDLSYNRLTTLPIEIFTITNIKKLYLDYNDISYLPEEITRSSITEIYLSHNKFKTMPKFPTTLTTLGMSYNELTEVDLSQYHLLTTAFLSGNKIETFITAPKLATVYLSFNKLKKLPVFNPMIKSIDVAFNMIDELPNASFPELNVLNVSYNKIRSIPAIKVPRVESIKLAGNPLQSGIDFSVFTLLDTIDCYGISNTKPSPGCRDYIISKDGISDSTSKLAKVFSLGDKRVGYAESQGVRPEMEDSLIVSYDKRLFAVFDGHGGSRSSTFATHFMMGNLSEYGKEAISENIKGLNKIIANKMWEDGATMALAQFNKERNKVTIAHIGDARALIVKKNGFLRFETVDHKPINPKEIERITKVGGTIVQGRVESILAITRAIGDSTIFGVSHECEYKEFSIESDDKCIVLACDGVFDVMTSEMVAKEVAAIDDPMEAAYRIRNIALSTGTMDNVSVIVIKLN